MTIPSHPETAPPDDDEAADLALLERCGHCGRYGWHETDRCPESAGAVTGSYSRRVDSVRVIPATVTGSQDVRIDVCTDQDRDGVDRYIMINGNICLTDPAAARLVAAELLAAADAMEGWRRVAEAAAAADPDSGVGR